MIKKLEEKLFEQYVFWKIFSVLFLTGLVWWIAYWPGTLQYDSCGQLLQYLGVGKMTGHHPYLVTILMGIFLDIGRDLFSSDNIGIFLYVALQFLAQCAVISYGFVVFKHMKSPKWLRWGSLFFYGVFPLFPNWGISYVKDTGYYISFLLLVFVIADVWAMREKMFRTYQMVLWMISTIGVVAFRNDGRYVVFISVAVFILCTRKYRREYIIGLIVALGFIFLVEGVCMTLQNIPKGSVREVLSVPMLQTVKYIENYGDEITEEEENVLKSVFAVEEVNDLVALYDAEISDPVKAVFEEYPAKDELTAYLTVWFKQFLNHPDVYFEAYWEHCDGYFNPLKKCYSDVIGWFTILEGEWRTDEYLDIYFLPQTRDLREVLECIVYRLYELPCIGWLFHTGVHTWVMLGSGFVLFFKKDYGYMFLLVPGLVVLLICTVSPLNASVRYYLPVMASTPVFVALCTRRKGEKQ